MKFYMKFYLAAAFTRQAEMREIAKYIEAMGHKVTSDWINQVGGPVDDFNTEPMIRFQPYYDADLTGINNCDNFVVFTDVPSTTGAYHVELGYAIARYKQIIIVGPRLNIFMTHQTDLHYADKHYFLMALKAMDKFTPLAVDHG